MRIVRCLRAAGARMAIFALAFTAIFSATSITAHAEVIPLTFDVNEAKQWEEYNANYIYNQLNADEKKAYTAAYNLAWEYLLTNRNAESDGYNGYTLWVDTGVKNFDAGKIATALSYDCPIFYYFERRIDKKGSKIRLLIREPYRDGSARAAATAKIKDGLNRVYEATLDMYAQYADLGYPDMAIQGYHRPADMQVVQDANAPYLSNDYIDGIYLYGKTTCRGSSLNDIAVCSRMGYECTLTLGHSNAGSYHAWVLTKHADGTWYDGGDIKRGYTMSAALWPMPTNIVVDPPRYQGGPAIMPRGWTKSSSKPEISTSYVLGGENEANNTPTAQTPAVDNPQPVQTPAQTTPSTPAQTSVAPKPSAGATINRLYNPINGEHLYTTDQNEANSLAANGWRIETSPGKSNPNPQSAQCCVFRLYNASTGEHLYTADPTECITLADSGAWVYDNNRQAVYYSTPGGSNPVYRLYNPGAPAVSSHHYTSDLNEIRSLLEGGWKADNGGEPVYYLQ